LARIGGRTAAGDELTVTERRTAELVARGLSNKQIAAALFVTVKTVETQLSRIYVRLDITPARNSPHAAIRRPAAIKP